MFQEWVDLLRQMVKNLPEVANLGSLKDLCDDDAEIDFFNNIVHLQVEFFYYIYYGSLWVIFLNKNYF